MGAANIATALTALIQLTLQAQKIQQLLQTAHAEGRDITAAELDALIVDDDAARQALIDAIDAARGQ
jgi:hypothetical protein